MNMREIIDLVEAVNPYLRTAVKCNGNIYVGVQGEPHVIAAKRAGLPLGEIGRILEDPNAIGFLNDRGRFLLRNAALQYAIDNDLIDPEHGVDWVATDDTGLITDVLPERDFNRRVIKCG